MFTLLGQPTMANATTMRTPKSMPSPCAKQASVHPVRTSTALGDSPACVQDVPVVSRAESMLDRRVALGLLAGTASLLIGASPSSAAYGEGANVFGRPTNKTGFIPYAGEGYALLLPSKWYPSREREAPNIVVRYADNADWVNNLYVIKQDTNKPSIEAYGTPEEFIYQFSDLLGKQSWIGETVSEGGFDANRVSQAALLGVATEKDKKGKTYYKFEILTRSADNNEGGRHQLVKATVSDGKLYLLKVQAGDKRWFKGVSKDCLGVIDSFTVA